MGDLNRGETFANGESLTGARLNKLQDDMTLKSGVVGTSQIADGAVTSAKLAGGLTVSAGSVSITSGALLGGNGSNVGVAITPDASTVEISSTTLRVKDAGIVAAKLATDAVTTAKILDRAVTAGKFLSVAAARLLGRFAGSAGDVQEISVGTGLALSGAGVLSATATTRSTYVGTAKSLPAGAGYVRWDGTDTPAWPFSSVPEYCEFRLVCTTADVGFAVGNEIPVNQMFGWFSNLGGGMPLIASTAAQVHFSANGIYLLDVSGAKQLITRSSWKVKIYAEKW
jgi:hypothetical protein